MDVEALIDAIRESLLAITEPRFYENERGFQGQLLVELNHRIPRLIPIDHTIIEQEHQKSLDRHGLRNRPDIIIHQPYNPELHASRRDGNFAVIELKLRADPTKAIADFNNLHSMLEILNYPVGIFINIDHTETQDRYTPPLARGRIIAFATKLIDRRVRVIVERT